MHRDYPHVSRVWMIIRVLGLIALVLPLLPHSSPTLVTAQTSTSCLGWTTGGTTYTTRRLQYTSDGVLHLVGCGEVFTLTDILNALNTGKIVGSEPSDALQLVDPVYKIWMLNVKLQIEEGATLLLIGGASGDVNWLRLRSSSTGIVWIRAINSTLRLDNTRISSWNPSTNTYDTTEPGKPGTDEQPGGGAKPRAFIGARSFLAPGRAWVPPTPCDVNGGSQDFYEARLDIINSRVDHLGYNGAEAYGVSWKVYTTDTTLIPPASRELYNRADIFGTVVGSTFDNNYFGAYAFGGYCMTFANNVFDSNLWYGLDPHDDTDFTTVTGNIFRYNASHGFICSVFCDHLVVTDNQAYNNGGNGIMIHRRVDGALIEGNYSYNNGDSGIAIFDSHNAIIRNNTLKNNINSAIRFSVGSSDNLVEYNTMTGIPASARGNGYLIYSFQGSDLPTVGSNRRMQDNVFRNNTLLGYKSPVIKFSDASNNVFENNTITAGSSLTTFEFRDGIGNLVADNQTSAKLTINTFRSSSSAPPVSSLVRNLVVGQEATIKHSPSGSASTLLEDTRFYVWSGISTGVTVDVEGTSATLRASSTTIRTRPLIIRPPNGEITAKVVSWNTGSPYSKSWTEISTATNGPIPHTVGDLQADACYEVTVDSTVLGAFVARGSGNQASITFTYQGGFDGSTPRTFSVAASTAGCSPPPDTAITSGPNGTVASGSVTFTYVSIPPDTASFECRLDAAVFTACPETGVTFEQLSDGPHAFEVRAVGSVPDPSPARQTWTIDTTPPVVTVSPPPGAYNQEQLVSLTSNEDGVAIRYTTDGTDPTTSSPLFVDPIPITQTTTVKFIGTDALGNASLVSSAQYTIDTLPPTVSADPPGGTYGTPLDVTLTADEPATIYYTTDGSTPSPASATYMAPIALATTTTLRFLAIDSAGNMSRVVTETFTIVAPPDTTIKDGPSGTSASADATFTYAANEAGATFECRIDGSPFASCPESGITYTRLGDGEHTFEVRAVGMAGTDPTPATRTWMIDTIAPSVAADPPGGVYHDPVTVTLISDDPLATIFYTTDGSVPTPSSAIYTGPIVLAAATTVQFIAQDAAGNQSALGSETYSFTVSFRDDFETGDLSKWNAISGLVVQQQEVYSGVLAARATSQGGVAYARKYLLTSPNELYVRVRFKIVSQGSTVYLLRFRSDTNGQILGFSVSNGTPAGKLSFYNYIQGVTTTSSQLVTRGVWHELQVRILVNGAASETEVWFDGARVNGLSGTCNLDTNPIGRIEIGESGTGRIYDVAFDDVAVDSDFIASSFVPATITPTPTKTPTATPTITPSPEPTATPGETPTEVPTATPPPAETPTREPTITSSPEPTATPMPELTATPTPSLEPSSPEEFPTST